MAPVAYLCEAVIVTGVAEDTAVVVMGKFVVPLAPTETPLGTWTAGLLLDRLMAAPDPAITVPIAGKPPTRFKGATATDTSVGLGVGGRPEAEEVAAEAAAV